MALDNKQIAAMVYRLSRQGKLIVNLDRALQCGDAKAGQNEFGFACQIEADSLDDNGFVIDQMEVERQMASHWAEGTWIAPCESLVGGGIRLVHGLMGGRALSIRMRIIPNANANVEATWERGMPLPAFVPQRITSAATVAPAPALADFGTRRTFTGGGKSYR
jgi:hypothetical protein